MKKEKLKSLAFGLVISVLGILGIGNLALALSGSFPIGIESCNNCSFSVAYEGQEEMGEILGASGTRFPNGISADSTSPSAGQVRGTTLTVTGAATLSGAVSVAGAVTFASNTRASSFVLVGAIATFSGTATATASNVCDSPVWISTPSGAAATVQLPSTTTLFSSCLTANGDSKRIHLNVVNTSTTFIAGYGGTLDFSSSTLVSANQSAELIISRLSDSAYNATLLNADR